MAAKCQLSEGALKASLPQARSRTRERWALILFGASLAVALILYFPALNGQFVFDDLSAKPHLCNPATAGSPDTGSQKGSQRRQAVTDAGPP